MSEDLVFSVERGRQWSRAIDDPALGILFQKRSAPVVTTIKKRRFLTPVAIILIVALLWLAWPYYAFYRLSAAIRDSDVVALEGQVDWTSVREGLRGDLNALFLQKLRSEKSDVGNGLAAILGPAVINQMVEGYVTPQTIAQMMRTGKPSVAAISAETPSHKSGNLYDPQQIERLLRDQNNSSPAESSRGSLPANRDDRIGFKQITYAFFVGGPFTFKVNVIPADNSTTNPMTLIFKWAGDWKLTRLLLPSDIFDQPDLSKQTMSVAETKSPSSKVCAKYDPETTQFDGIVTIAQAFGPPNFGQDPLHDTRERFKKLTIKNPICVYKGPDEDEPAIDSTSEFQLVFGMKQSSPQSFPSELIGQSVTVIGKLFAATTGHHHTPLLIDVTSFAAH